MSTTHRRWSRQRHSTRLFDPPARSSSSTSRQAAVSLAGAFASSSSPSPHTAELISPAAASKKSDSLGHAAPAAGNTGESTAAPGPGPRQARRVTDILPSFASPALSQEANECRDDKPS